MKGVDDKLTQGYEMESLWEKDWLNELQVERLLLEQAVHEKQWFSVIEQSREVARCYENLALLFKVFSDKVSTKLIQEGNNG